MTCFLAADPVVEVERVVRGHAVRALLERQSLVVVEGVEHVPGQEVVPHHHGHGVVDLADSNV